MTRVVRALWAALLCVVLAASVQAQEAPAAADQIDYGSWEATAQRIEGLLVRNQARPFVLEGARDDVVVWRNVFSQAEGRNAGRLATLDSQIAALGPVPAEGESEPLVIENRRALLLVERDTLAAPSLLAAEANARAAGLIAEIEAQLSARAADDLLQRSPSPLLPSQWPDGWAAIRTGLTDIGKEVSNGLSRLRDADDRAERIAVGGLSLVLAVLLLFRGRRAMRSVLGKGHSGFSDFVRAVGDAIVPLLGLIALAYGLTQLDIFGTRGHAVLYQLPVAGSVIILSGWLCRQFFPAGERMGPLQLPQATRQKARRTGNTLAWLSGLWMLFEAFLASGDTLRNVTALWNFPAVLVISVVLFRFANLIRTPPLTTGQPGDSQGRTRRVIGGITQLVALACPVLAAFGYGATGQAILFPMIMTLGLLGVLIYVQALVTDGLTAFVPNPDETRYALVPIGVGLVLYVLSSPLFALIWGASTADLRTYWLRFTEGVSWGETQIAPADVFWLVVIFGIGYLLTQFIKTSLKTTVLPRTSLDLGAQNAIVAGFGYVGIFLAAVVAITSAGIDLSNLAIVAGALSVGIGFGLQTIVSNFVSGIILLIERPISEGDWIEVGGQMGYVRDISVRSTRIETFDRTDVIVPNADLVSNQVINWTRGNLAGRLILPVGVAYGSNVDQVMGILKEIAEGHPMVIMNPPPSVLFVNFGADALEFEIRAILRDINFVMSARSEINVEIARRFEAAGIEIPFAQRDIWLRNAEVLGHVVGEGGNQPASDG